MCCKNPTAERLYYLFVIKVAKKLKENNFFNMSLYKWR